MLVFVRPIAAVMFALLAFAAIPAGAQSPTAPMRFAFTIPIDVSGAIVPAQASTDSAPLGYYNVACAVGPGTVAVKADLGGVFRYTDAWGRGQTQPAKMPAPASSGGSETLSVKLSVDADVPVDRTLVGLKTATYVCLVHHSPEITTNPRFPDRSITGTVKLP